MRQSDVQAAMNKMAAGGGAGGERSREVRNFNQEAVAEQVAKVKAEAERKAAAEKRRRAAVAQREVSADDVKIAAAELNISEAAAKERLQECEGSLERLLNDAVFAH